MVRVTPPQEIEPPQGPAPLLARQPPPDGSAAPRNTNTRSNRLDIQANAGSRSMTGFGRSSDPQSPFRYSVAGDILRRAF